MAHLLRVRCLVGGFIQLLWAFLGACTEEMVIPDCGLSFEGKSMVPRGSRANVENDGKTMPFGITLISWDSAHILSHIAFYIGTEVLGINANFSAKASSSVEGLESLLKPTIHAAMELWTLTWISDFERILLASAANAPRPIGKMHYAGYEGTFVSDSIKERAEFENPTLHLEYYKCYNRSVYDLSKYFQQIHDIPSEHMLTCNSSRLWNTELAKLHIMHTGDDDGVESVNGESNYKCLGGAAGHWWLSPACRGDNSTCIPWVTVSSYSIDMCTQQAVAYNMPIACGVAATFPLYGAIPKNYSVLFYWWVPDITFVGKAAQVIFPHHDRTEWSENHKASAGAEIALETWVNVNITTISPQMEYFLSKLALTKKQMDAMLMKVTEANSTMTPKHQVACAWLKDNVVIWRKWLPDETSCDSGKGLANKNGRFVPLRTEASGCDWCPSGTRSVPLSDAHGATHRCTQCQPGFVQRSFGQSRCVACKKGTFANSTGLSECVECGAGQYSAAMGFTACKICSPGRSQAYASQSFCPLCLEGTYTSLSGSTACEMCAKGRFASSNASTECVSCSHSFETDGIGSKYAEDCVCPQHTYLKFATSRGVRTCVQCEKHLNCPGGISPLTALADTQVTVLAGYMVMQPAEQLVVFYCAREQACPVARKVFKLSGGIDEENMCQGRHTYGIGCAGCTQGTFAHQDGCEDCFFRYVHTISGMLTLAGCWVLYYKSMFPPQASAMALGSLFSFAQALLLACQYSVPIPKDVLNGLFDPLSFTQFDFSMFKLSLECAGEASFIEMFFKKLCWPVVVLVCFSLVFLCSLLLRSFIKFLLKREIKSPVELLPETGNLRMLFDKAESATAKGLSGIPLSQRLMWFWHVTWVDTRNAVIKTQNAFFIVLTTTALTIFRLKEHPSGVLTVISFPAVIYKSPEWLMALPLSLLMLATFTVGYLAFITRVVFTAPQRVGKDMAFHRGHRCLWAKFDPSSYWFSVVHLIYALFLNLVPVFTTNARIQLLGKVFVNALYILILCHLRPWKFQVNHTVDLATKLGLCCFVLFTVGSISGNPIGDSYIVSLMLTAIAMPCIFAFSYIVRHVWYTRVDRVGGLRSRVDFAQRFHDILKITSSLDTLEIRAYAIALLDNDVKRIDYALDVLQFTIMGLQSRDRRRWRAATIPFEIAIDGRLEGEMLARGVLCDNDMRGEIRRLNDVLHQGSVSNSFAMKVQHGTSCLSGVHSLRHSGVDPEIQAIFDKIDVHGSGSVTKDAFAESFHEHLKKMGAVFSKDTLRRMFDFIDVDQSGHLTSIELAQAFRKQRKPVLPSNYKAGVDGMKLVTL